MDDQAAMAAAIEQAAQEPVRGRRARRCGARRRRTLLGAGPQPARPAGQRHPPRRDGLPRERRPPARVGLSPRHDVHDALAVRHVHRRDPAVRHPARGHRREPRRSWAARTYLRARGVEVVNLDSAECKAAHGRVHRALPRDLERGHRRGVTRRPAVGRVRPQAAYGRADERRRRRSGQPSFSRAA